MKLLIQENIDALEKAKQFAWEMQIRYVTGVGGRLVCQEFIKSIELLLEKDRKAIGEEGEK